MTSKERDSNNEVSQNLFEALKGSQFRRLRKRDDEVEVKKNLTESEEYREYVKTVFARSYIASFADVAESPSIKKKLFVLSVFFFSVFGLIYQATDFTNFYMTYPTLKNELYLNPFFIEQPAITICNANRYRRSAYCKEPWMETTDFENETEFCTKYDHFCPDQGRPYPQICKPRAGEKALKRKGRGVWKLAKELGHSTSMIISCTQRLDSGDQPCKEPYHEVPTISNLNQDYGATYCFTINSDVGKPDAKSEKMGRTESIRIEIQVEPDEYSDYAVTPSIYVSIHDRKKEENPFFRGSRLIAGTKYLAQITDVTENKLMPAPYDTNCTDYLKTWKENGGHGPLTAQECTDYCVIQYLLKRKQCIPYSITYSHNERLCEDETQRIPFGIESNCSETCNNPCFSRSYEVSYVKDNPIWCRPYPLDPSIWCSRSRINLTVSFTKFRLLKTSNDPRMQDIEFFSNVGGYLGMWIGISLVDGIDFLGCVYLVIYFPILRRRFKEAQKKKELERKMAKDKQTVSSIELFNKRTISNSIAHRA